MNSSFTAFTYSFVGRGELVQDARYNMTLLDSVRVEVILEFSLFLQISQCL